MKMLAAVALFVFAAAPAVSQAQSNEYAGPKPRSRASAATDQIIVKWRTTTTGDATTRAQKLSAATGVTMQHKRLNTARMEVFKLDRTMEGAELQTVIEQVAADSAVEYAVPDQRRWIQQLPTDPMISQQWYFLSTEISATRTDRAWDVTTGTATTVVAVLDTGVRFEHPDLGRAEQGGKLLAGYDFISNTDFANDGTGRDADASDPGDWVEQADLSRPGFGNCDLDISSWHGTRVSSMIAAQSNEAFGMAGAGWSTLILPVRVLGKCGGFDSDIMAGMRWAAGLPVDGVPANSTPAKIINMSLGGDGACNQAYQDTVNQVTAQGTLIVASVGNAGTVVGVPANCPGVLGVSGLRHAGTKVGYSSLGAGADIGAPAGNCVNTDPNDPCIYSILAAINTGTTVPLESTYTDPLDRPNYGTSFSAPIVAGAAALMHSVNTRLTPAQFTTLLQETATTFPTTSDSTPTPGVCQVPTPLSAPQQTECICTTATCGAGMLNTSAAVLAAQRPFAIAQAPSTIDTATAATINGSTSFASNGRTVTTYQWSAINVTGATPAIADSAQAMTTVQVSGASQFTLRLTVTDNTGAQDTADVAMATSSPPSSPAAPSGGGGGGGGSFDWLLLVLGLLPLALPGPRRRKARARVRRRAD